jgi:hypothetical protein
MRFRELLRNFLLVLGPLLLVLLAVFFWNRSLRTQVLLRTKELRESERRYRLLSENLSEIEMSDYLRELTQKLTDQLFAPFPTCPTSGFGNYLDGVLISNGRRQDQRLLAFLGENLSQ